MASTGVLRRLYIWAMQFDPITLFIVAVFGCIGWASFAGVCAMFYALLMGKWIALVVLPLFLAMFLFCAFICAAGVKSMRADLDK